MANPTPEQLVKEIYEQLSSFRSASEQLAEHAETSKATVDGWKSLTVKFTDTAERTRKGIEDLVRSSAATVDVSKAIQSDLKEMISHFQEMRLATRLESLEHDQKEMLKHIFELRTKHLERLESIGSTVSGMQQRHASFERRVIALLVVAIATAVLLAIRLYGLI